MALVVQRRREEALKTQVQTLQFEKKWERQAFRRLERYRQEGLEQVRSQAAGREEQSGPPPFPTTFTHD